MVESIGKIKEIGGYFGLEDTEDVHFSDPKGILLNTARNALEYILKSIGSVRKIYLPYYTCEVVLEPVKRLNIPFQFYNINCDFEMETDIVPEDSEYIIVNNYFGIKDDYINRMASLYGDRLIIDNAQALFAPVIPDTKSFYSLRKFIGVADGGIAAGVENDAYLSLPFEQTETHNKHLYIRKEFGAEAGFSEYRENEGKLDNQPIRRMSEYTSGIFQHVNLEKVVETRRNNYAYLEKCLSSSNKLKLPPLNSFYAPMVYPYLPEGDIDLRGILISKKIFVARYWPNVLEWAPECSLEFYFANNIIPLPIDQRYGIGDMQRIADLIQENLEY